MGRPKSGSDKTEHVHFIPDKHERTWHCN